MSALHPAHMQVRPYEVFQVLKAGFSRRSYSLTALASGERARQFNKDFHVS